MWPLPSVDHITLHRSGPGQSRIEAYPTTIVRHKCLQRQNLPGGAEWGGGGGVYVAKAVVGASRAASALRMNAAAHTSRCCFFFISCGGWRRLRDVTTWD